jgi:hypothetical protein
MGPDPRTRGIRGDMSYLIIAHRFVIGDMEKDLLGRGGMGAVYRATDTRTGELVTVKALDPHVIAGTARRTPEPAGRAILHSRRIREPESPRCSTLGGRW